MLHTLVPSLSSLMAPAAQLCINLDTRMLLRSNHMQYLSPLCSLLDACTLPLVHMAELCDWCLPCRRSALHAGLQLTKAA